MADRTPVTAANQRIDIGVAVLLLCALCIGILAVIGGMDVAAFAYKHTFENVHNSN